MLVKSQPLTIPNIKWPHKCARLNTKFTFLLSVPIRGSKTKALLRIKGAIQTEMPAS